MLIKKRYRVDFYDMFDGWIYRDHNSSENDFESLDDTISVRDKKNSELGKSNKKCGEHYGVIDLETNMEVCCPTNNVDWLQEKDWIQEK